MPLPLTLRAAVLFVTSLAQNGLTYKTIKVYLAAILNMHVEAGYVGNDADHPLLHRTLQGIKRSIGDQTRIRLPITMTIMRQLKNAIRAHPQLHMSDKLMLWSAFTMAFFGFMMNTDEGFSQNSLDFLLLEVG